MSIIKAHYNPFTGRDREQLSRLFRVLWRRPSVQPPCLSTKIMFDRSLHDQDIVHVQFNFGDARQSGSSHRVYKTPWKGDPRVNIQNSKGKAKAYQVKQVLKSIERLEVENGYKK